MKNQFDVTQFEVLETSGEVLKGGFSAVYTGGQGVADGHELNALSHCGDTENTNCGHANCGNCTDTCSKKPSGTFSTIK